MGASPAPIYACDWRMSLPVLAGIEILSFASSVLSDAPPCSRCSSTEEVSRFISPPPTTAEGYERFIVWSHREREKGRHACYAVVPAGLTSAGGHYFRSERSSSAFDRAEWGFALGAEYWARASSSTAQAGCSISGSTPWTSHRLEARAAMANGRGNGALRKLGAIQEGILRQAFLARAVSRPEAVVDPGRGLAAAAHRPAGRRRSLKGYTRPTHKPDASRGAGLIFLQ